MKKFFQTRGMRKFLRSKMAVTALAIILGYCVIGLWVSFGLITTAETNQRVAANHLPGFFRTPIPEARLQTVGFYMNQIQSAVESRNPEESVRKISYAERRFEVRPAAELQKTLDGIWETYEELIDSPAPLAEAPELWPKLDEIENRMNALFIPLSSWDQFKYDLRTCLGTDRQGRSISMRGVFAIKVALQVGFVTSLISVLFGTALGAAAGFFGGWVDHAVIFLYSVLSSVPNLVLLTVLMFVFMEFPSMQGSLIPLYASFCATFWIGPCRVIRGETLKLKELEYIHAATAIGFGRFYVLFRHLIPNVSHLMFINFSLLFIGAIKSEVILTFLGLGVKEGSSWGVMIFDSQQEVTTGIFWQLGAATVFMFGLVLAFNILSDALQDAFDPKHT